jgi:hypothetical protein
MALNASNVVRSAVVVLTWATVSSPAWAVPCIFTRIANTTQSPVAPGLSIFPSGGQAERGQHSAYASTSALHVSRVLPSDASLRRDLQRGTVRFLRGANLSRGLEQDPQFRSLQAADRFADVAVAFLSAYRLDFRLLRPVDEMVVNSITTDALGFKRVRLKQMFAGIPIWGAELIVQLDRANHINLVQGRYIPTLKRFSTIPGITGEDALAITAANLGGLDPDCPGCRSELVIFAAHRDPPRLAYRILIPVSLAEGWVVMADAFTGTVIKKLPSVYE